MLTNDIVSFEQLGPDLFWEKLSPKLSKQPLFATVKKNKSEKIS